MSNRYLPLFDENGDVINPAFFTEGMGDMAGEINGGLDRDNFAQADIVLAEVDDSVGAVFATLGDSYATDTSYVPDQQITTWQGGTANDASGLGYAQWTAEQDAHYDIMWNGTWSWGGAYSWSGFGTGVDTVNDVDALRVRITVDGVEVAVSALFEDGAEFFACYLCGSIQLPAGTHTLRIECEIANRYIQVATESVHEPCENQPTFGSRTFTILQRTR